jgi:hypothetical protein
MNSANIEMLERAAAALEDLSDEVVFVGGTTIELWATDPAPPEFRPTKDVDVIVEIATRMAYYAFEERLRALGFANEPQGDVLCRFRHVGRDFLLDAMPIEASILGFENRRQREAFPHAIEVALPSGRLIRAVPPTYLLATKLEAFSSRGNDDLYASHDFEDIVALVDNREELVNEVSTAKSDLKSFVGAELARLLCYESFASATDGALAGGPETLERFETIVRPRVEAMATGRSTVEGHD